LTRGHTAPALNIAHCVRDLAFGDASRTGDFVKMVDSNEPEYRSIFERCYFRGTFDVKNKKASQPTRKPTKGVKKPTKNK
jgi:hypothetical protein